MSRAGSHGGPTAPGSGAPGWVTGAVIAVGVVLIVIGITRGEPADVLASAVTVCLSCIGLG